MKAAYDWIIHPVLALLVQSTSFAQLGKTADECTKFFGRPAGGALTFDVTPPARTQYQYVWSGFYVRAHFVGRDVTDSRCGLVTYSKHRGANEPAKAMTGVEIERILALNAHGARWAAVSGGWKRSDNRALAVESKYMNNGVPDNSLAIFAADFYPKDSESFMEVRATVAPAPAK